MLNDPATNVVMLAFPCIRKRPSAAPTVKARREAIAAVWAVWRPSEIETTPLWA